MIQGLEWLSLFTTISLVAFIVLVMLAALRMCWRLGLFLFAQQKVPVLLKRDIVLFGTFAIYFGLVLVLRLSGAVLTQNPFWVVPSTVAVLSAIGYWVWVEYHLDE